MTQSARTIGTRRAAIVSGFIESLPIGVGLVPLGVAFGLVITSAGFSWWWAPVFSILIYAGSMEFLAVSLITGGVGPLGVALTAFLVNFRHLFYGLSYPRDAVRGRLARAYVTYSLTDEAYAINSLGTQYAHTMAHPGVRIFTVHLCCQATWVLSGCIGALGGKSLPDSVVGMEFALPALFIVLAWEAFASSERDISLPFAAIIATSAAWVWNPRSALLLGLSAFAAHLLLRIWSPRFDSRLRWVLQSARTIDPTPREAA